MRRTFKIGFIILPWLLLLLLVWDNLRRIDFFAIDAGTQAHSLAAAGFLADLSFAGCVSRDDVLAAAEARGWSTAPRPAVPCPEAGLRIQVQPALPFSTDDENDLLLSFDQMGCMIAWADRAELCAAP
ncbi:hypothetical protein V8J82_12545 [Gymnodinialimonas sp. 2305UL16-5]|uniref:hypothetical protein n=1 Tax=Gymnodinialimonas mytili TaxID=3126503 RepID=UPI0030A17F8D